jgi:predicted nucleic acid-binding protein
VRGRAPFARDYWSSHPAAARINYDCRRRGLTVRSTLDYFIAQLVLEEEGSLLHDDADFRRIRRVRPLEEV